MGSAATIESPLPTERTLLQAVGVARWAAWVWLALTTLLQRRDLDHPILAAVCVGAALAWTIGCTTALTRRPALLLSPPAAVVELALGWVLLVADGTVFADGHSFGKGQNLAGAWPLIAVLSAATVIGPWWGGALAAAVGSGRAIGAFANGIRSWPGDRVVSLATTVQFYAVGAVMWGWLTRRLRHVEGEVAMVRARDEVARTLHDGVLQTLALVERRTRASDPQLANEARRSDRELRAWLFHDKSSAAVNDVDLRAQLRLAADDVARAFDLSISVSVIEDEDEDEPLSAAKAGALTGAVREALVNVGKHASPSTVVVFAEVADGEAFATVRDDGCGFDPSSRSNRSGHRGHSDRSGGEGIRRSIEERMADVGGRVEIVSTPGAGTEVRLWTR